MKTVKHSFDARRELVSAVVTLNGRPAKISGIYNDAATVWPLDNPAAGVAFAWATVERIVAAGGAFKS